MQSLDKHVSRTVKNAECKMFTDIMGRYSREQPLHKVAYPPAEGSIGDVPPVEKDTLKQELGREAWDGRSDREPACEWSVWLVGDPWMWEIRLG